MSWSSGPSYTPSVALALLLTVGYGIGFFFLFRRTRTTAASMPLTLPPLLLGTFAGWVGYANTVGGWSRSGGGRAAGSAGIAEALEMLGFGTAATSLCAGVALVAVVRGAKDAIGPYPRGPVIVATSCWLLGTAALGMPLAIRPSFAVWNTCLLAAFVALALLVAVAVVATLGHRRNVSRRNQLRALGITLALATLQTAVAWSLVEHFRSIAVGLG